MSLEWTWHPIIWALIGQLMHNNQPGLSIVKLNQENFFINKTKHLIDTIASYNGYGQKIG